MLDKFKFNDYIIRRLSRDVIKQVYFLFLFLYIFKKLFILPKHYPTKTLLAPLNNSFVSLFYEVRFIGGLMQIIYIDIERE